MLHREPGHPANDGFPDFHPLPLPFIASDRMLYRNRMEHGEVPITHRSGRVPDAPIIARMARDYVEHGLRWTWRPRRIQRALLDRKTTVLVAETPRGPGMEIAGFAIMRFDIEEAHLSLLAVRPSYRRRRIARNLLERLENSARMAGMGEVRLEVRTGNDAALELYRQLGYREVRRLPGYYGGCESALRMARDLAAGAG